MLMAPSCKSLSAQIFAQAAANKAAGTDREGVIRACIIAANADRAAREDKRAKSKKMKPIDPSSIQARAAACDPPRVDLGMINLAKSIPSKAVLAEECLLRGILGASVSETQAVLLERLSSYHKLKNESDVLIPQLTTVGKAATKWRDSESQGSAI